MKLVDYRNNSSIHSSFFQSKKDKECLPKVLPSMLMLLTDEDVNVQKKVILTSTSMFKITLEVSGLWNCRLDMIIYYCCYYGILKYLQNRTVHNKQEFF